MTKQIQINKELFDDLIDYFWSEDFPRGWLADEIRHKLNSKLDKMLAWERFTQIHRPINFSFSSLLVVFSL